MRTMSDTHVHKHKAKYKKASAGYTYYSQDMFDRNELEDLFIAYAGYNYYSRSPSWFRNLFETRPSRRKEKKMLDEIKKGMDGEKFLFPLARKPFVYYY